MKDYELLPHTGDIGIIVRGKDVCDVFAKSARAMFDILVDLKKVKGNTKKKVALRDSNCEELLRAWLGELLYIFSVKGMVFSRFDIKVEDEKKLTATAYGEKFNNVKHNLKTELKAVTYHKLCVKKVGSGYKAQVVFDV